SRRRISPSPCAGAGSARPTNRGGRTTSRPRPCSAISSGSSQDTPAGTSRSGGSCSATGVRPRLWRSSPRSARSRPARPRVIRACRCATQSSGTASSRSSTRGPRRRSRAAGESMSPAHRRTLALSAIVGLVLLAFSPAFSAGFLYWDDDKNFFENTLWRGLSADHLRWMATTFRGGPYQPLSWLSLAIDHAFFGMDPRGYHAVNVALHAGPAVAFFFLARR